MRWADYATGRPPASAIKAAGFGGVIRYIGLGGGATLPYKRITAAEYQDHVQNGLQVLLVCEGSTTDAWAGYNAGRANAQIALDDAHALGIPDAVGIAAAADSHAANQAQIDAAVQYARGFQDVLGKARTGFYGFSETVNAVKNAGIGSWYWRCGSQPTSADQAWTNLWQRNDGTTTVAGTTVDINEQYQPITSQEDDLTPDQSQKLDAIYNQLAGSITAGQYPGWPIDLGNGKTIQVTPVDMLRALYTAVLGYSQSRIVGPDGTQDTNLTTLRDLVFDGAKWEFEDKTTLAALSDAVKAVSTGDIDVSALATALTAALGPEMAKAIGEKLVA
jgi:hypothetical protein